MINVPIKFHVSNFTRYGNIKDVAKCRKWGGLGWLGITQGHWQWHHSTERIELLLAFRRKYAPIWLHFWDITRYWSKSTDVNLPHLYMTPLLGWCCWNFAEIFGVERLKSGYRVAFSVVTVILGLAIFVQLVTDRRTDRHTMTANTMLA